MSRFDGWEKPDVIQKESATLVEDFDELRRAARRGRCEDLSLGRARHRGVARRGAGLVQRVGAAELRQPRSLLVTHFFNHQTHHRGQAHALITACGEKTGDTDLFLVVPDGWLSERAGQSRPRLRETDPVCRKLGAHFAGSGMNSISSPGTLPKWPAVHSALACSMRSLRDDTKFHQMWRGPSIGGAAEDREMRVGQRADGDARRRA